MKISQANLPSTSTQENPRNQRLGWRVHSIGLWWRRLGTTKHCSLRTDVSRGNANPDGKPPLAVAADRRVWCPPKWELRKQKLLSPNFGIQNFLKKFFYETNTWFFSLETFLEQTKTPANHWVQVAFGAGAGRLGAVLHIQLQWQIHHCSPHHTDLELSSIPALRLALQIFYNSKKIVQNEFPWKELF